jgi:hypothetical protein
MHGTLQGRETHHGVCRQAKRQIREAEHVSDLYIRILQSPILCGQSIVFWAVRNREVLPLCKYTKPASEFQRRPNAPGGLHTYCSKCKGKTERFRKNVWSHERFVKGLEIQDHQCAVSGIALNEDDRHTHADHCHKGNFPRALLNAQINQALGKLKDSPLLCLKLVAYAWAWGGEMPANATVVLAEEMVKQRGIRLEYERFEAQMALPQAA